MPGCCGCCGPPWLLRSRDEMNPRGLPIFGLPLFGLPSFGLPSFGLPIFGLPLFGLPIFGLPVAGARDDSMPPSGEDRDDEVHCESGDDESGTEGGGPPWLPRPRDETNPPGLPIFGSSGAMEGGTYGGVGGDGRGDVRRLTWGGVGGAYRESLAAFLPHDGALDLARNAALAALAASSADKATAAGALAPAPLPPWPLPSAAVPAGTSTTLMAWMMPLLHATSVGACPMTASPSHVLRKRRSDLELATRDQVVAQELGADRNLLVLQVRLKGRVRRSQ